MQYGFALGFQAARERSKKTKAVSAMQTQPAVCIARGGTKRQNKKSCCARLRFVSFDSDEGPGEIGIPRAPLSLPYFLSRRSEKESMKNAPFGKAKKKMLKNTASKKSSTIVHTQTETYSIVILAV